MTIQITRDKAVELFTALGIPTASKWNAKRMSAKLSKVAEMVDEDMQLEGDADNTLTTVLEAIEHEHTIEVVHPAASTEDAAAPTEKIAEGAVEQNAGKARKAEKAEAAKAAKATTAKAEKAEAAKIAKTERDAKAEAAKAEKAEKAEKAAAAKEAKAAEAAAAKEAKAAEAAAAKATKTETAKVKKAERDAKVEAAKVERAAKAAARVPTRTLDKVGGIREGRTRAFLAGVVIKSAGCTDKGVTEDMVNELDELYGNVNRAESFYSLRTAWHVVNGYEKGDTLNTK